MFFSPYEHIVIKKESKKKAPRGGEHKWDIPREEFLMDDELGEGNFGEVYKELDSDKDFTTFLKELKLDNGFHERCAKLGILHFDTELTILEKKDRKLVVVNNNTSWKHALKLLLRDEAELHVKIFDVKRVSSCNFFEVGNSGTQDVRTKDSESVEPSTKKIKSHHANHSDETKAKISLWHRIKDAQKMGIDIVRNDTEQKLFQEFKKDIAALASSVAVNEIDVNCGLCGKTVMMNKVRARAYFIKNGNNNDSDVQEIQGGSDNDTNDTNREEEKQESDASEILESGEEM